MRLAKNQAKWLSAHKSSYWDCFDKTNKLTSSVECVTVILRVLSN